MRYHSTIVMLLVFIIVYQYLSYNSELKKFENILVTFKITMIFTILLGIAISKRDEGRRFPDGPQMFVEAPHFIKYNIETDMELYRQYQIEQNEGIRKNTLRFNRTWTIDRRYSTNIRRQRIIIYPFLMRSRKQPRFVPYVPSCSNKLSYYQTGFNKTIISKGGRNFVLNSSVLITTSIEEYLNAIINYLFYLFDPDTVFNNGIVSKNVVNEGYRVSGTRSSSIHFLNERTGDYTVFKLKVYT